MGVLTSVLLPPATKYNEYYSEYYDNYSTDDTHDYDSGGRQVLGVFWKHINGTVLLVLQYNRYYIYSTTVDTIFTVQ